MHIVLLTYSYPNDYNEQSHIFFQTQAQALAAEGLKVGVVSVISISFKQVWNQKKIAFGLRRRVNGGCVEYCYQFPAVPFARRANAWLRAFFGKRLFRRYSEQEGRPALIHVHVSLVGKLVLWIHRRFGIPYVVTEHYSLFLAGRIKAWEDKVVRQVFDASAGNFAVSPALAEKLSGRYHQKVEVIPNLVDTAFFSPHPDAEAARQRRRFLCVGNLKPEKNHAMLIRAFHKAFRDKPEYSLTIVGSGILEPALRAEVKKLGMQKRISFFGQATKTEVRDQMRSADLFVLSSRFETFGVVVIEAMSCGLPVVTTRCGGPESIIEDASLGMVCENNEDALASAMAEATGMPFERKIVRAYAEAHFSAKQIASKLIERYEGII